MAKINNNTSVTLNGIIVSGLGKGSFFISMPHYIKEIKKRLGFKANAGTLNLKVGEKQKNLLKNATLIRIEGYKSGRNIFGGADCYKARIKNINGAIILPDLSKHKDVIEFIAPVHLKSELNLKDGDEVSVVINKN